MSPQCSTCTLTLVLMYIKYVELPPGSVSTPPHLLPCPQAELVDAVRRRRARDDTSDEEDLGLPRSPPSNSPTAADVVEKVFKRLLQASKVVRDVPVFEGEDLDSFIASTLPSLSRCWQTTSGPYITHYLAGYVARPHSYLEIVLRSDSRTQYAGRINLSMSITSAALQRVLCCKINCVDYNVPNMTAKMQSTVTLVYPRIACERSRDHWPSRMRGVSCAQIL
ncbi:hypothetical protein J6590_052008 [Homalodisca vitripennis]|nr:hypothetical protein J6590_052008 [Homalodisca vitripennis]